MTINKTGGNKHKKAKNRAPDDGTVNRKVIYAETGQIYAVVQKKLGGTHLQVLCSDGKIRQAIIPGKFRKRVWMNVNDVLLCTLDAVGKDDVCGIDHKYFPNDIATLRSQGLITFENDNKEGEEQTDFSFDDNTATKGGAANKKKGTTNKVSTVSFNDMFIAGNPNRQSSLATNNSSDEDSDGSPTDKVTRSGSSGQTKTAPLSEHEKKMQKLFSKNNDESMENNDSDSIDIDNL